MSNESLKQIPQWVWWSLCPVFGALTIAYAGYLTKTNRWLKIGLATSAATLLASIIGLSGLVLIATLVQFVIAISIKNTYLIKIAPRGTILPTDRQTAKLIADIRGQVDINQCSKDDLVHVLGLPIVYANNIESIKAEGFQFIQIDDLRELADVPAQHCQTIEPLVAFRYYETSPSEGLVSWQRLNILALSELVELGLDRASATVICNERQLHGTYRSLIEVKRRTGIPINLYKHLI
jgi:Helix-hairpin-helix motif